MPIDFAGKGTPLLEADMQDAIAALGMGPAEMPVLWSVLVVESRGFGFLVDRRPKLLFERHIFFQETRGRFAVTDPDLCAKNGGGYIGGAAEYERIARALALCRDKGLGDEPALRSASWGLGQVMGFNAQTAGFASAAHMVAMMSESEGAQLAGMIGFINSEGLDRKLRTRDWTGFARRYNGPAFWKNQYDVKLKSAFEKFSSGISRDLRARAAQGALSYLGYKLGDPDGVVGQNTRRAIVAFRRDHQMGSSESLDDEVFDAILRKAGFQT
jgi:hypothetical protein